MPPSPQTVVPALSNSTPCRASPPRACSRHRKLVEAPTASSHPTHVLTRSQPTGTGPRPQWRGTRRPASAATDPRRRARAPTGHQCARGGRPNLTLVCCCSHQGDAPSAQGARYVRRRAQHPPAPVKSRRLETKADSSSARRETVTEAPTETTSPSRSRPTVSAAGQGCHLAVLAKRGHPRSSGAQGRKLAGRTAAYPPLQGEAESMAGEQRGLDSKQHTPPVQATVAGANHQAICRREDDASRASGRRHRPRGAVV